MGRRVGTKQATWRQISFRTPAEVYEDLVAYCRFRGMDLSAVINGIVTDARPALVKARLEHERAMREAAGDKAA